MADDKATDKATDKTSSSSSSRRTMAPAAVEPAGVDDRPISYERLDSVLDDDELELAQLDDDELDELTASVQRERRRRGREPREPSFGLSEGERDELERTGRTVSPFTGERRGDWSREDRRAGRRDRRDDGRDEK